jgi:uncharacterized protein
MRLNRPCIVALGLLISITATSLSVSAALVQSPVSPQSAIKKPYRERLLERARKGEADAQFELGKNYETGRIGLPKDFSEALHWYREAAAQGNPYAEASLGILFNFGKGVERDYFQAYVWYERAALHSTGGDRASIVELRDRLADDLTQPQIERARNEAQKWKPPAVSPPSVR